ncbi:TerB family tellurite resistance protein [Persicimonas caeni]|nr:TerB family tellurite resistance protein [Persicimonas caeni]
MADPEEFDFTELPDEERLAFFGALFCMSAIDGEVDREELFVIYELIDSEGLSDESKEKLRNFVIEPPDFKECLDVLNEGNETLRYALMINLVEVAKADALVDPTEEEALQQAQLKLGITDAQFEEIVSYVETMQELRERGVDDDRATDAVKAAVSGMTAVGVPVAAVYFSGSIIGLSAAGITSGLAALGLGLGMVPGIGVAALMGAAAFGALAVALDLGSSRKKETLRKQKERRAQRLIANLQDAITHMMNRVEDLRQAAEESAANREAIEKLTHRIRQLKKIIAKRKKAS